MKVEKFDMEVFKKVTELQKKFNIQFDPQIPVPEDDDLADRVFQAGVELCLSGAFIMLGQEGSYGSIKKN
jgi:methylamine--corrinoid protein Co-methyltransferase